MAKVCWSAQGGEMAPVIRRAHELHRRYGRSLASDPRVAPLLEDYTQAIAQTGQLTRDLGIPAFCMACAARDGVCCFAGVERRYDEYLLLMNLLLGDPGAWDQSAGPSCYFCGPQGCLLLAKHSFCHNFFCAEIKQALGEAAMARLNRQVGRELCCQWELERVLLPWLWAREGEEG